MGKRKLTDEQVMEIKHMYATGLVSQQQIANRYNVSRRCVGLITTEQRHKDSYPVLPDEGCVPGRRSRPWEERYWNHVLKSPVDESNPKGCWYWTGGKTAAGYGLFHYQGKKIPATHVAIKLKLGRWPLGRHLEVVMHTCDNPECQNPDHLILGTQSDNQKDAVAKGRHTYQKHAKHLAHRRKMSHCRRGENAPNCKLTDEQVREIVTRVRQGEKQKDVAADYGVKPFYISKIMTGQVWGHIVRSTYVAEDTESGTHADKRARLEAGRAEIIEKIKKGVSLRELAEEYGVARQTIQSFLGKETLDALPIRKPTGR